MSYSQQEWKSSYFANAKGLEHTPLDCHSKEGYIMSRLNLLFKRLVGEAQGVSRKYSPSCRNGTTSVEDMSQHSETHQLSQF